VHHTPPSPRQPLGGASAAQQAAELALLLALASPSTGAPPVAAANAGPVPVPEPSPPMERQTAPTHDPLAVDRLAAWLLQNAGLAGAA
jgi:hypothetical protein